MNRFFKATAAHRMHTPWMARAVRRIHLGLNRLETQFLPKVPGCKMVDGLYARANGRLPCWCGPGEALVHGQVGEAEPLALPSIVQIRSAFAKGLLPFPDLCENCQARQLVPRSRLRGQPRVLDELHLEPSFLCGLGCSMCPENNAARRAMAEPPYHLPLPELERLVSSLKSSGIRQVRTIRLEGKGEPLLHPEIHSMIRILREAWPATTLVATTSGSLPPNPELATSGLDLLTFSVDGYTQEAYEKYRVRGQIQRVLDFMRSLREEIERTGSSLQLVWKYILFSWNDDPTELLAAGHFCSEQGIAMELRFTHSENGSTRWTPQSLKAWAARELPNATVRSTLARSRQDAEATGDRKKLDTLGLKSRSEPEQSQRASQRFRVVE